MGLFDFLKPKKDPVAEFANKPGVQHAMVGMDLEYLQKQVANFVAVGRSEDAKKAVKAFLEKYGRESQGMAASSKELAQVCYTASYQYLPNLVHKRWPEFQALWTGGVPFPIYFAITVASVLKKRLSVEQLNEFEFFEGKLGDGVTDYFMIQFPVPPPQGGESDMDALLAQLAGGGEPSLDAIPVLGPYFAVVLHRPDSGDRWLYILGQSPGAGTTLRSVTADGANCNCGPGPEPAAKDFLEAVQRHL